MRATYRHAETGREALVRRRVTTTVMASARPVRASVRSATFVTVIAFSVGATAASNANSSIKVRAARTLSRRQSQSVPLRKRAAKTAAAAGNEIQKMSIASQVANVRPARMRAIRALNIGCSFRDRAKGERGCPREFTAPAARLVQVRGGAG